MKLKRGFLCLHLGAGYHSDSKSSAYKELCNQAIKIGVDLLNQSKSCIEVATAVTSHLENSPLTNAGFGSNLTQDDSVECEAAIMESNENKFAAVGCVKEIWNPIQAAEIVLREQKRHDLGLVPPMVLVGDHVAKKAMEMNLKTIENKILVSTKAQKDFVKFQNRLNAISSGGKTLKRTREGSKTTFDESSSVKQSKFDPLSSDFECSTIRAVDGLESPINSTESLPSKEDVISNESSETFEDSRNHSGLFVNDQSRNSTLQTELKPPISSAHFSGIDVSFSDTEDLISDTIGVICVDHDFNVASAISSGGLAMKQPGRLGPCTSFGAGCWSFTYAENTTISACCSGTGEAIIRTHLAQNACDFLYRDPGNILKLDSFINDYFTSSRLVPDHLEPRLCGLLLVTLSKNKDGRKAMIDFQLVHTADSFCVSYISAGEKEANFMISRLKSEERVVTKAFHFSI